MASKLKKYIGDRQRCEAERVSTEKRPEDKHKPDRRPSVVREDGDEFPSAPNIAQRRLPRRTPTSHVKGVGGDLIRRRLGKTNEQRGSTNMSTTFESSFEEEPSDERELKPPTQTHRRTEPKATNTPELPVNTPCSRRSEK